MTAALALTVLLVGMSLVLDRAPWFARGPLTRRLSPYCRRPVTGSARTIEGLRELLGPGLGRVAGQLTRLSNPDESLSARLEFVGAAVGPTRVRLVQVAVSTVAGLLAIAAVLQRPLTPVVSVALLTGAPALAALSIEHRLNRAVELRRQQLLAELPVLAEQLGMLLAAGYSVTGAIGRLADRSDGTIADELQRIGRRIGHGLSEHEALAEWADRSRLDAVRRLVSVLALRRESSDLGALIAEEARSIRATAHQDLIEDIERRGQLVWIPVTVATLVPGLLLLAVPFISAMAHVSGTG